MTPYVRGLHELGDQCYAYLQPDGSWGWIELTAAMLDAMASIRAAAPISTVVNTHANGDHCYGNPDLLGAAD